MTRRNGWVAGLVAAAAVLAVIAGILAITRGSPTPPVTRPSPTPATPSPTPTKTQSPRTWADTPVSPTRGDGRWHVPDPLKAARDAWFGVVAEHLDAAGEHLTFQRSDAWGVVFLRAAEGSSYDADTAATSAYTTEGRIGLMVSHDDPNLLDDGCAYLRAEQAHTPDEQVSCSSERFTGPAGERARVSRWERRCGAYEGGNAPATCGDYVVAVAVDRGDGLVGYLRVGGRGTPDFNPFTTDAMAAAAADPGLTLPQPAFTVPSEPAVRSVVADHLPGYRNDDDTQVSPHDPGYAHALGTLGRRGLSVQVWPAGRAPSCGRSWLVECVERRVFGADDPTTVFVGTWDEDNWADCCPRNSRATRRGFVYVGPRHTVVVSESLVVRADEEPISAELDQRLIDLVLDPRLQ